MKVKLATQTLSNIVAVALNYLNKALNEPEFHHSEATSEFVLMLNNIFDILNSRNIISKGFKAALQSSNVEEMRLFTKKAEDYLSSLKLQDGNFVINTKLKTEFIGFIICMRNLIGMFDQHVENKSTLKYILYTR